MYSNHADDPDDDDHQPMRGSRRAVAAAVAAAAAADGAGLGNLASANKHRGSDIKVNAPVHCAAVQ